MNNLRPLAGAAPEARLADEVERSRRLNNIVDLDMALDREDELEAHAPPKKKSRKKQVSKRAQKQALAKAQDTTSRLQKTSSSEAPQRSSIDTLLAMRPSQKRRRSAPPDASAQPKHTMQVGDKIKGKGGQDADTGEKVQFRKYFECTVVACTPQGYTVVYDEEPDRKQECPMALARR